MDTAHILPLHLRTIARSATLTALAVATSAAFAQTTGAEESPSDRAKRQAENPMKWIMMLDDKPRQVNNKPAEKKAPAAPAARGGGAEPAAVATPAAAPAAAPARAAPAAAAPARTAAVATAAAAPAAVVPVAVDSSAAATAAAAIAPAMAPREPEPELPEPLTLLTQVQPELTRDVLNRGIRKGNVKVKFNVMPDGSVADVEVTESSNRALHSSVINAVRKWKYAPVKRMQGHGADISFNLEQ